jgi:DNA-3-methyladenine glycosylase II
MIDHFKHLKKVDPILGSIVVRPLEPITPSSDLYLDLIRSIVSQQLSVKAASTIYTRFLSIFKNNYPSVKEVLGLEVELMRSAGLSYQKISYIKDVARYWESNKDSKIDLSLLPTEQIIEKLTEIKGVGVWTVEMILIFSMGRDDIFSVNDLGLVRACEKLYYHDKQSSYYKKSKKDQQKEILELSKSWVPYRSFASRYLWDYKDSK